MLTTTDEPRVQASSSAGVQGGSGLDQGVGRFEGVDQEGRDKIDPDGS